MYNRFPRLEGLWGFISFAIMCTSVVSSAKSFSHIRNGNGRHFFTYSRSLNMDYCRGDLLDNIHFLATFIHILVRY